MPSQAKLDDSGSRLGRFIIQRELGRGAFGVVYLARDPQLERLVALKVPSFRAAQNSKQVTRFLREAKAAAGLHHPNIVAVHDAGQIDDQNYIASAFIDGTSLRSMLAESGKPSRLAAARLVAKLADALAYAHDQGIVHRDVKPDNVLLDRNGNPYLVDFGLARREIEDVLHTQDGTVLGTPAYMSPEQAAGKGSTVDGRADQWSLGVILYELLVGSRPFQGDSMQIMYAIQHTIPESPRKIDPSIPLDLNTICTRCLSKDPNDRFANCRELADDLERWIRDEPIMSRRQTWMEQWSRWSRRNPLVARLSLALVFSIVTLGSLMAFQWMRAEWSAIQAVKLYDQAEQSRQQLESRNKELVDSRQQLAEQNEKLDESVSLLRTANDEIENQKQALQIQLKEVQLKEKQLRESIAEKELAENAAMVAEKESDQERQKRIAEEAKNKKLRYVGDIAGVRAAIISGNPERASAILASTPKELRSLEWNVLRNSVVDASSGYQLVSTSAMSLLPEYSFLNSISFPESTSSPSLTSQLLRASNVLSISDNSRRWLSQTQVVSFLDEIVPADFLLDPVTQNTKPEFTAKRIAMETLDSVRFSTDIPVLQAWISPNGRYVACVAVKPRLVTNDNQVRIFVDFRLLLQDLEDTSSRQSPFNELKLLAQAELLGVPTAVGTVSIEPNVQVSSQQGTFSPDSTSFLFVDSTNQQCQLWNTSQPAAEPITSPNFADARAVRFDSERITLALPNRVQTLNRTDLKPLSSSECIWPIANPEHVFFSSNGSYLGLASFVPKSPNSPTTRSSLNLYAYQIGAKVWHDCSIGQAQFEDLVAENAIANQPDARIALATKGIMRLDRSDINFVAEPNDQWLSFHLGKFGSFSFIRSTKIKQPIVATSVWQPDGDHELGCLQWDSDSQILYATEGNKLLSFERKNKSKIWKIANSRVIGDGPIVSCKPDPDGNKLWIGQPSGIRILDTVTGDIRSDLQCTDLVDLIALRQGAFAYAVRDGRMVLASSKNGETLKEIQAQLRGVSSCIYDDALGYLLAGGGDRSVTLWNTKSPDKSRTFQVEFPTRSLQLNKTAKLVTQTGVDGGVRVFSWPTMKQLHSIKLGTKRLVWADMSNDGNRLMTVDDKSLQLVDPESGTVIYDAINFEKSPNIVAVDDTQTTLFVGFEDGSITEFQITPASQSQ